MFDAYTHLSVTTDTDPMFTNTAVGYCTWTRRLATAVAHYYFQPETAIGTSKKL